MTKREWVSIPEFAKRIGKTSQYIRKLVKSGKIEESATRPRGKRVEIDVNLAVEQLENNTSYVNKKQPVKQIGNETKTKLKTKPTPEEQQEAIEAAELDPGQSLSESQRQKALYDAAIRKLDLDERAGESLKAADVEKDAFEMARRVRDAILNVPNRISPEIASMTDVHLVSEKLTTELVAALEELSGE